MTGEEQGEGLRRVRDLEAARGLDIWPRVSMCHRLPEAGRVTVP